MKQKQKQTTKNLIPARSNPNSGKQRFPVGLLQEDRQHANILRALSKLKFTVT